MISRAQLRGKPLDDDCRIARQSSHEYGMNDNRVFCYGLMDRMTDEYLQKCRECGAFVDNAEPPDAKQCELAVLKEGAEE